MKHKNLPLYIIVIVLTISSFVFRIINENGLEQSSILFVGLPALIAFITIKFYPKTQSLYGIVFKVITLFLIMSGILFGEGIICILIAAPIFYGVGWLLVFLYSKLDDWNKTNLFSFVIIPLILILSQPIKELNKPELISVSTTKVLNKKIGLNAFEFSPNFQNNLPNFFKLGFPKPVNIAGESLEIGSIKTITFDSMTKGEGVLTLEVIELNNNSIKFKPIGDSTHINHWLSWNEIEVHFKTIEDGKTQIQWESKFYCDLSPAWYFQPIEKYSVNLMNEFLISSYFE